MWHDIYTSLARYKDANKELSVIHITYITIIVHTYES